MKTPPAELLRLRRRYAARTAHSRTEICQCGRMFDPRLSTLGCSSTCRENAIARRQAAKKQIRKPKAKANGTKP